jgi:predicted RNA binding protein YcfA (HicA-like mRNA interferase family)
VTPRLTPLSWRKLVCVFEQIGYRQAGQKGSHIKLEKAGVARPLIVPRYDEVGLDIIANLIRTAGITREAFLVLLDRC